MVATIQLAEITDLDIVLQLVQAFHRFESVDLSAKQRENSLRSLIENPELGGIWLICCDSQVIGYVALCLGYSIEFAGKDAFVDEFYIEPNFRGRGLGRQTLELIKDLAREMGIQALHLEVGRSNIKAQNLYAQAGFEVREKYVLMSEKL
ncbi:GNAT family N-acetyltransferase [Thermoleptolyngbya sp. M55_K2018_002]|uniref:GNAT family N-acetyltransferase n=1 Tax=Thermoleptolyngbya sp. M55_K2018_002 TaxID=2747808 RepID=UPI0019E8E612|nr:GNAT family N-acetyltransferase [Thermoleptolyngbya sp. M55_K2018_002]HIK42299.1 GNAT family N-acetyltransferase [Thermoleptolyngbya sp. M55_K2018_002]